MRTWTSPEGIAFEGVQTGDGRVIVAGALAWEDPGSGWPLRVAVQDQGGHYGAELVGTVRTVSRVAEGEGTNAIRSTGDLDDEDNGIGADTARRLDAGQPYGVSVDLDDMAVDILTTGEEDDDVVIVAGAGPRRVVASLSGLSGQLRRHVDGGSSAVALWSPGIRATLTGLGITPPAHRALTAAAGEPAPPDAIIMWSDAMDEVIMSITRARLRGLTIVDIPAFDRARIVLDAVGAATEDEPAEDPPAGDEARADAPCIECGDDAPADVVPIAASGGRGRRSFSAPVAPPRAWFTASFTRDDVVEVQDPQTGDTIAGVPMHYGSDGRVFGHIALWRQCHTGSPDGQCVYAPRSGTGYRVFRHGQIETAEGDTIAVGNLTIGGGHADVRLSYRAALDHYDNVGTNVAQLAAGEDEWGIWVAGAGRPAVWRDDEAMRDLRAASPSGDWRAHGGRLELVHAHCVNAPGFPVPRAQVAAGGQVLGLVAAGAAAVAAINDEAAVTGDLDDLVERLAPLLAPRLAEAMSAHAAATERDSQVAAARQFLTADRAARGDAARRMLRQTRRAAAVQRLHAAAARK